MRLQLRRPRAALVLLLAVIASAGAARTAGADPKAPDASNLTETVSSDVAEYADTDHVFVFTPSIAGTVANPTAGWSVSGDYLVDVVSAASVDIVSTASRRWEEVRNEGSLSGTYKPGTFGASVNAGVSSEPDYLALNAGGSITQDLRDKTFTWLLGYNYGHDVAGITNTPFSVFSHEIDRHAFKAGATIVINKTTIASFVGDVVVESGDQSKPYRYIPLFAPGVYVPVGASPDLVNDLRVSERPREQLPLSRDRYAFSVRFAHRLKNSTLRLDERFYTDSWGLKATSRSSASLRRRSSSSRMRAWAASMMRAATRGSTTAVPRSTDTAARVPARSNVPSPVSQPETRGRLRVSRESKPLHTSNHRAVSRTERDTQPTTTVRGGWRTSGPRGMRP